MRFLNTTTLQFDRVPDSELDLEENQYAILSHRWYADEDEVTYEDLLSPADASPQKDSRRINTPHCPTVGMRMWVRYPAKTFSHRQASPRRKASPRSKDSAGLH